MNVEPSTVPWGARRPAGWKAAWLKMLRALPEGAAWRRFAFILRKPLKRTLDNYVDVEVWGLKLRLCSRGNLSEQRLLLMPQFLDSTERKFLTRELKDGDVFLDIGANAGVYSLWVAASCGPKVQIEAFEPDPELCHRLRFNLHTNNLTQVTLHEFALGRISGEATLVSGGTNRGQNRVEDCDAVGTQVRIDTLPNVLSRRGITRIKALKIDVEGHESDVLSPLFEQSPASLLPEVLICELTSNVEREPLQQLLARHGYTLVARGRLNGIFRRSKN